MRGDEKAARGHVICGQEHPDRVSVFSGFRRFGVDVEIELNVDHLLADKRVMSCTRARRALR